MRLAKRPVTLRGCIACRTIRSPVALRCRILGRLVLCWLAVTARRPTLRVLLVLWRAALRRPVPLGRGVVIRPLSSWGTIPRLWLLLRRLKAAPRSVRILCRLAPATESPGCVYRRTTNVYLLGVSACDDLKPFELGFNALRLLVVIFRTYQDVYDLAGEQCRAVLHGLQNVALFVEYLGLLVGDTVNNPPAGEHTVKLVRFGLFHNPVAAGGKVPFKWRLLETLAAKLVEYRQVWAVGVHDYLKRVLKAALVGLLWTLDTVPDNNTTVDAY